MNNPPMPGLLRIVLPSNPRVEPEEISLFERKLQNFVPAKVFDAHAHLYSAAQLAEAFHWAGECPDEDVGFDFYRRRQSSWMGTLAPQNGLFFAAPARDLDVPAANNFVQGALKNQPGSRGLLMIKPGDDPTAVEAIIRKEGWAGFKVYHVFTDRQNTQDAHIDEYLPEWAWDIAHRHGLALMLHMVRARSLADASNQKIINAMCRKYPNAKLILAHAARGFCAHHTIEGVQGIAGLDNVYFDTSAICEAAPFEAVLQTFGPSRLLYGSDFPVSELHGRAVSLGDGFYWIYDWEHESWPMGKPVLVGIESLLALRRACDIMSLSKADVERVFYHNARELLRL